MEDFEKMVEKMRQHQRWIWKHSQDNANYDFHFRSRMHMEHAVDKYLSIKRKNDKEKRRQAKGIDKEKISGQAVSHCPSCGEHTLVSTYYSTGNGIRCIMGCSDPNCQ